MCVLHTEFSSGKTTGQIAGKNWKYVPLSNKAMWRLLCVPAWFVWYTRHGGCVLCGSALTDEAVWKQSKKNSRSLKCYGSILSRRSGCVSHVHLEVQAPANPKKNKNNWQVVASDCTNHVCVPSGDVEEGGNCAASACSKFTRIWMQ
jgi:hypothetical protein